MSKFIHTLFVGVVLLGLSVPVYAQANDVDCVRCVDASDIAREAVTSHKIKPKAVTTDKLAKQAVTTSKLAPQAVTTGKIQDGAVTSDKLSPELSDSIQATESAVDALETKRGVLDQNELTSIWSNSLNAHFDLVKIGNDLYTCGQSYLYGCDRAISADGTEFGGLEYYPGTASVSFFDPIAFTYVSAIPTDIVAGYGELRFVGVANLAAWRNQGQMLVDDCDNPTVGYVQLSRNPRGHSPPQSVINNSGQHYELDSYDSVDVDVTGNTYGVMNFIIHGDQTTPICTPGVSDRTGIWQQYTYSFVLDLSDARFAGPFTYQGSSIGLLDRVEALENPVEPAPPPPPP